MELGLIGVIFVGLIVVGAMALIMDKQNDQDRENMKTQHAALVARDNKQAQVIQLLIEKLEAEMRANDHQDEADEFLAEVNKIINPPAETPRTTI